MAEFNEDSIICLSPCTSSETTTTSSILGRRRRQETLSQESNNSDVIVIESPSTTSNSRRKKKRPRRRMPIEINDIEDVSDDIRTATDPDIVDLTSPSTDIDLVDLTSDTNQNINNSPTTEAPIIQCPVCLENFHKILKRNVQIKSTTCGHLFCQECMDNVMSSTRICPICRMHLRKNGIRTLYLSFNK